MLTVNLDDVQTIGSVGVLDSVALVFVNPSLLRGRRLIRRIASPHHASNLRKETGHPIMGTRLMVDQLSLFPHFIICWLTMRGRQIYAELLSSQIAGSLNKTKIWVLSFSRVTGSRTLPQPTVSQRQHWSFVIRRKAGAVVCCGPQGQQW